MTKAKNYYFDKHLNDDDRTKLAQVIKMGEFEEFIELFKAAIADKYEQIYEASQKQTLREYFAEHIEEISEDNQKYNAAFSFSEEIVQKIKSGKVKHNIKGFVCNCTNADALILDVHMQKNVPALYFDEDEHRWHETTTTIIKFNTTCGKYMYVSAINSLKTEEFAAKYLDQIDRFYYYKNRNKNIA